MPTRAHLLLQPRLFFLAALCGMAILGPWPGIESVPSAVEVQSLNRWTAREVPPAVSFTTLSLDR